MTAIDEIARPLIEVRSPIDGALVGTVPAMRPVDAAAAVDRARAAQPAWAALGTHGRAHLLRRWADAMWRDRQVLFDLIRAETGKAEHSAYSEAGIVDNVVAYYALHGPRWLRQERRRPFFPVIYSGTVDHVPYPVVGAITPWNYPYLNLLIDVIPALVAGCAVVIKPSEFTPLTALYAVEKMHAVGIPRDVIQLVTGMGEAGRALVDVVDYVTFTGSTAVGRAVGVRCAERLIACSLELGGKDAMIVLNDADVEQAALGALRGGLENAGQACIGIERIYAEAGVYDHFVATLRAKANDLVCGAGGGFDVHMGSLTQAREIERVERHQSEAVAQGARVEVGGQRLNDRGANFYAPTVLTGVDHTMAVMREETFGPLLPVMKVRDADEAVRLANDSPYGLSGAVYSRDVKRARAVAARLQTGDVSINGTLLIFTATAFPMGGFKQSGIGRRGGREGLMRFTQPRSIIRNQSLLPNTEPILADRTTRTIYGLLRRVRSVFPWA